MAKPKLEKIEAMLSKGKPITLTDAQYERKTGASLPKGKYYLLNNSAIARLCKKYGFIIELQEKTITLKKGE
ncbi:MAG: hypothetical protein IK104_05120 [Clostridia bacterium]|nr:hypothetical protein [Clostridia bacterium]